MMTTLICFWLICVNAQVAHADIYSFEDEDGAVYLTDSPSDEHYQLLIVSPKEPSKPLVAESVPGLDAKSTMDNFALQNPLYHEQVKVAAKNSGVETALIHAVITAESNYNPRAVSPKGATGLMQLMPQTARRYGVANLYDPEQNIQGGARYLAYLLELFKNDSALAVAAYNAGENAVIQHGNKIPPYRETMNYVNKVMSLYKKFRRPQTGRQIET